MGLLIHISSNYLLEAMNPLQLQAQSSCQCAGCLHSLLSQRLLGCCCLLQHCKVLFQVCSLHWHHLLQDQECQRLHEIISQLRRWHW